MFTEPAGPMRITLLAAAALGGVLATLAGTLACRRPPGAAPPLALGDRRELFVDDQLIAELRRAELRVHPPTREELVAVCDAPWEGNGCGCSVMYFRIRFGTGFEGTRLAVRTVVLHEADLRSLTFEPR